MVVNYEHLRCDECGGSIGMYNRFTEQYTCGLCNKHFDIFKLEYDTLMINDVTGWIFPVVYKEEENL